MHRRAPCRRDRAGGGDILAIRTAGQDSYTGSLANGIQTRDWGSYGVSFVFAPSGPKGGETGAHFCARFPDGAESHTCLCTPEMGTGSVWGSGPYTADSDICAAARHAGVLGPQGGMVTALGIGGLESYAGTERNGVATRDWGSYGASFIFDANR